jgi:D-alanyl-D-alanine carboxypeptidase
MGIPSSAVRCRVMVERPELPSAVVGRDETSRDRRRGVRLRERTTNEEKHCIRIVRFDLSPLNDVDTPQLREAQLFFQEQPALFDAAAANALDGCAAVKVGGAMRIGGPISAVSLESRLPNLRFRDQGVAGERLEAGLPSVNVTSVVREWLDRRPVTASPGGSPHRGSPGIQRADREGRVIAPAAIAMALSRLHRVARTGVFALAIALSGMVPAQAEETLAAKLDSIAAAYLANTAPGEKATAISISVSLPRNGGTVNVAAGTVSKMAGAAAITPDTLFQIGSITKSFTAVTLLQLQAEGVLDLDDSLGQWLPEYPAWRAVTLRQLLNMTSGIPSYDNSDAMIADIGRHGLSRHFSPAVLVGFVDPAYPGAPAATKGYAYSNTNYILAGMVIEKASGLTVQQNFERRLFGPRYGLTNTSYRAGLYPPAITGRMASGYIVGDGSAGMKALDGADVTMEDMSWGGAAGAAVSRPEEVNLWVRALFNSAELLDADARAELTQVVSMQSGDPLTGLSPEHPRGFGLGVSGFRAPGLGSGWQYEGETMGFRTLYLYLPEKDLVVTVALNSGAEGEADHAGKVALTVLEAALEAAQTQPAGKTNDSTVLPPERSTSDSPLIAPSVRNQRSAQSVRNSS